MTDIVLPEMLTRTFDQFKDPIAIASTDSRFLYANLSVAKLAGFRTPDGMRDKYYEEVQSTLFEDAEVIKNWKTQDQLIASNTRKELRMLEVHPGGAECPYINRKIPLYNESKECVGIVQHVKYLEIFTPNDFIRGKRPGSLLLSRPDNFFTETECEVIFLKLQGMTSKDIGKVLCRSRRTIESTVSRLYDKAGVNNNTDFVEFCEKRSLHRYLPHRFLNYKKVSFENDSFF